MDIKPIRVVVTGHDADGNSGIVSDAPADSVFYRDHRPVAMTDLWHVDSVPVGVDADRAPDASTPFALAPGQGGAKFRIVQFEPETDCTSSRTDGHFVFGEMGEGAVHVPNARHPFMHRTATVDFALVLEGQITMLLDDGEVHLEAGDVLIQRATNHAWSNRGTSRCLVAFVLIDADPNELRQPQLASTSRGDTHAH